MVELHVSGFEPILSIHDLLIATQFIYKINLYSFNEKSNQYNYDSEYNYVPLYISADTDFADFVFTHKINKNKKNEAYEY